MIDVNTTWSQACAALALDNYDQAFSLLSRAMPQATPQQKGVLALYMASVHSLYGETGLTDMYAALQGAVAFDPAAASQPLFQALQAEYQARLAQETPTPDSRRATLPPIISTSLRESPDPLTRYHALCALALCERPQEVLAVFLPVGDLPEHLRWRLRSWQADAHELLGQTQEASALYGEAAHLARDLNRAVMWQEQAALLLQLGQLEAAQGALAAARLEYGGRSPEELLNLATWYYLHAQVLLGLEQTEAAQTDIAEAARLEEQYGDPSYGVALVRGQILAHQGQMPQAIAAFEEALERADEAERPFVNHELGVALLDLDRPVEALERLDAALHAPNYPYQPEVLADMAECEYRLGQMPQAQATAERALSGGAVVAASMVLGNVALDYYHLDEALEHYERVVREAAPESRDWVMGHQMAADVLAQQGFRDPAAIYAHAQQALSHTAQSDDWYITLQDHLHKAQALLQQAPDRTLN